MAETLPVSMKERKPPKERSTPAKINNKMTKIECQRRGGVKIYIYIYIYSKKGTTHHPLLNASCGIASKHKTLWMKSSNNKKANGYIQISMFFEYHTYHMVSQGKSHAL